MKKDKKVLLGVVLGLVLVGALAIIIFRLLQDENAYTLTEKRFMIDNKSSLISIEVANDVNIFGNIGEGVFYDFLEDFEEENDMTFNIVASSIDESSGGLSLAKGASVPTNSRLFYTDHFVLVGKEENDIGYLSNLSETIGYLNRDENSIRGVLNKYSLTLKNYEDRNSLVEGLESGEVSYIIVPRIEYLDFILDKLYFINYHFSDIQDYYYLQDPENSTMGSILKKYYTDWKEENQKESFDEHEYELFVDKLRITEKEEDAISNKKYKYAFIDNAPYDVKSGGSYGGTISKYVEEFSNFSGLEFEYDEYSNFTKLKRAIERGKVDMFMNYYSLTTSMTDIRTLYRVDISFVMNNKDGRVVNDIAALKNEVVYVKKDSMIEDILKRNGLKTEVYSADRDLKKIFKENGVVAMEYANYLIYKEDNEGVNERFRLETDENLHFQVHNTDTTFNKLFSYYVMTIDKNEILYPGIEDYHTTVWSGTLIYKITKYALIILLAVGLVIYFTYKMSRKTFARKKIKRADKMKYIDILTSLKNRNYLNENIAIWNQNTIYPQAIVVIDLNGIQRLNDSLGYEEGDKQIQSAANALIKTQLDNSEIMRTDGNEFTVYLVGYNEKQVLSYIKKLTKEFKNLPHDKQAAIGFAMIEDDIKLLSDAINEATEKMKENKALYLGVDDEEKI